MNGFTWLLLAFPIYLLAKGRFVDYALIAGGGAATVNTPQAQSGKGLGGLNNNQALT